jgi:hypothetical protein
VQELAPQRRIVWEERSAGTSFEVLADELCEYYDTIRRWHHEALAQLQVAMKAWREGE